MRVSKESLFQMYGEQLDSAVDGALSGLKPFQRATVEHIDDLFAKGAKRVLVADEVGLGKTLVARGVVAKTARRRLDEGDDLFKVVYVCSNSAIVNQNLAKLAVGDGLVDRVDASQARLSMQHFTSHRSVRRAVEAKRYIQLIPLTPGTSFNVTDGQGTVRERALLFAVLRECDALADVVEELEELLKAPAPISWEGWKEFYAEEVAAESGYIEAMKKSLDAEDCQKAIFELRARLLELRDKIASGEECRTDGRLIGKIRKMFALLSVESLDPDLVIMDEFQRFRSLIDSDRDDDLSIISKRFLSSESRGEDPVRVLLLSATPYKPFTTRAEDETFFGDDSAHDFLEVVSFLKEGDDDSFAAAWNNYGSKLAGFALGSRDAGGVEEAKRTAEDGLRQSMARTERLGMNECGDIVKDCSAAEVVAADAVDVASQLGTRRLMKELGVPQGFPTEYVESCPFMLSYLSGYKLGKRLKESVTRDVSKLPSNNSELARLLWLDKDKVNTYQPLNIPNSRFRALQKDVFASDAASLLWVPASRPYYSVEEGPFAGSEGFSKTLVFSSWTMAPRMMSTLLSYEDERRSLAEAYGVAARYEYFDSRAEVDADDVEDDDTVRRLPFNRLRIKQDAERGAALLMYPSSYLAGLVKWPEHAQGASLEQLLDDLEAEIDCRLRSVLAQSGSEYFEGAGRGADMSWYAKSLLLLDGSEELDCLLGMIVRSADLLAKPERDFADKLGEIRDRDIADMGSIPQGLCRTLAEIALASPAVCAARTFKRCQAADEARFEGFRFAAAFARKMNTPASTLAVDAVCKSLLGASHWRRVLRYCVLGNLQSVLDEYAHQLGYGFNARRVCDEMIGYEEGKRNPSLYAVKSRYKVDTLDSLKSSDDASMRMRTEFAAAFLEDEGGNRSSNHRESVRRAFDSPFRPFVLCSTSVGQEGLDFHPYCRKIVHWNLPSNPIDMEQREGRINRYECLAVRQNAVRRTDTALDDSISEDVWARIFDEMEDDIRRRSGRELAGLSPHWGLDSFSSDDFRIERHTYLRRFGIAEGKYDRLIDILVRYRAVLGQPRQEELLEKLGELDADGELMRRLFLDLSPYSYGREG